MLIGKAVHGDCLDRLSLYIDRYVHYHFKAELNLSPIAPLPAQTALIFWYFASGIFGHLDWPDQNDEFVPPDGEVCRDFQETEHVQLAV